MPPGPISAVRRRLLRVDGGLVVENEIATGKYGGC